MPITIRSAQSGDLPALLSYRSDPRFQKVCPVRIADLAAEEARFDALLKDPARRAFTVCLSSAPIGSGNIRPFRSDGLEIGFEISPDHWGHGHATRLCRFLLDEAGKLHTPQCVVGRCVAFHHGSQSVMRKAGMNLVETERLSNGLEFVTYAYTPTGG